MCGVCYRCGGEKSCILDLGGGGTAGRGLLVKPSRRWRILKWIFKQWDGVWTGLIWLRIGTDGGLL